MNILQASVCCALLFLASEPVAAGEPQVPEGDGAKFVRLTRQLERDPLGDADKSTRTWLLDWATESKDVTVTICEVLGPIPGDDVPYGPELLTQYLFGNAAFQIANPDLRSNLVATQIAGIRSSMKAYSEILRSTPEARIPYFDMLVASDGSGELEDLLAPTIKDKCTE